MTLKAEREPTERHAHEIARDVTGWNPASIRRFATGIGHWVYEVRGGDGSVVVVRMGAAPGAFRGAIHWSKTLRPLGVPLPRLLAHGEHRGLPYLVLERLRGEDLGKIYATLSPRQRQAIAEAVCEIQRLVSTLPLGSGYGFVGFPDDPTLESWKDVVAASLARSRERIQAAGLVSLRSVELVSEQVERFSEYFAGVPPTPFLDDVTTKNVLVHAGAFSGIVDVDWVCYGDPLFTVALTRTSILSQGATPDYTDHWCAMLRLTGEQRRAVRFYTALFCVDFLSEYGQTFNRGIQPVDRERLALLEKLAEDHLKDAT